MKKILIPLIILIVLALGGGGYYAYMVMNPAPERVMGQALMNLTNAKTVFFSAELTTVGTGSDLALPLPIPTAPIENNASTQAVLHVSGGLDLNDPNTPKASVSMSISSVTDDEPEKTVMSFLGIVLGDVMFMKILQVPIPAEMGVSDDLMPKDWVKFDPNAGFAGAMMAKLEEKLLEKTGKTAEQIQAEKQLTDEEVVQIKAAFADAGILTVISRLEDEEVNAVAAFHYAIAFHPAVADAFLSKVIAIAPDKITEADVANVRSTLAKLDESPGEIWIGKKDRLPHKLVIDVPVTRTDKKTDAESTDTFHVAIMMSNFNQPVEITEPEEFITMEEFFNKIMKTAMDAAKAISKADDDKDGLKNTDEDRYGTDQTKPDTDGDGYSDGDEVKNGYNPKGEGKLNEMSTTSSFEN